MKKIPNEIQRIAQKLEAHGFEAFLVGGCLRDMILGVDPKDWDVATNATPDEVQKLFWDFDGRTKEDPATIYENDFGTVGIKTASEDSVLKVIEVTTYRIEGGYSDMRHPDDVQFAKTIEEDLSRRDFTVNAVAFDLREKKISSNNLVDPFGGLNDISKKIIRTVGEPNERFTEDALRLMRAVRFSAQLGFSIEEKTREAILFHAGLLEAIAKERIRDEFSKLIMTPRAAEGIITMEDTGLLQYVIPELREGIGCGQNKHHIYTVFDHNVRALNYAVEKDYSLEIRLGALLHDVGKPKTKRGDGIDSTFHGHEVVGAKMTAKIMDRLRFSKDIAERVIHLVRYHLFYYNVGEVSEAGVRRFISRVGIEMVDDLLKIREADRIGSGVPKAFPYKLRHLQFMIEKVRHDPVHPKMLKLNGTELMKLLNIKPSRRVGYILSILLEDVLENPKKNTKEYLEEKAKELHLHDDVVLADMSQRAREIKDEFESGVEDEMKKKYKV
ncbi:HD domain-containing protein [Candidatus Parcubacteria bacterium]|jgi:poly(A) polymerase/tRNA nucleotidyltransferase (CCA-adding enzyme)|nr:MAG: HD domain-containing protein [Candidatus Parcubacteria bacterium]